jgi:lipid A ethanolaminephosphotransferase
VLGVSGVGKVNEAADPESANKGNTMQSMKRITTVRLIVIAAVFIVLFNNLAFFRHLIEVYLVSWGNIGFLASLAVALTGVIILLLTLVSSRYTFKPILILILFISSISSYFMNNYNTVIDHTMIENIFSTNMKEAVDLFSFKLVLYVLFLGLLPALWIYWVEMQYGTVKAEFISRLKLVAITLAVIFFSVIIFSKFYTSFLREHKQLRYRTNPTYSLYSMGKYLNNKFEVRHIELKSIGEDAKIPATDNDRELVIVVIGEAARMDRFSINGYTRETNPLLKKDDVISLRNVQSCGTTTSVSVPCMFSIYSRGSYSEKKGKSTENLLDVLSHTLKVNILWRDNNSDSKDVALRVQYEDYKNPDKNPICDEECRDEGMLEGLQDYIDSRTRGDILIILHQMGNHGPAYYKRYPKSFEKFKPACQTNELNECTNDEINNAYDNAILYTDYFLHKVIKLLKQNDGRAETAMIYLGDHGESLGEKGVYLHGLPYFIAPDTQKNVAAIFWLGDSFKAQKKLLKNKINTEYTHENLFHTLLGLLEVNTSLYDKKKDIVYSNE